MTSQENKTPKQKLDEIENKLVQILKNMGQIKGRSDKTTTIATYVTIRKEVTQKTLRDLTGYSLGTVSSSLQTLEKMGLIKKIKNPQSRELTYIQDEKYTNPQSKSMANVIEYLSELQKFLKKIDKKLDQPKTKNKKGCQEIKSFISEMNKLFPAIQKAITNFSIPPRSGGT